MHIIIAGAARSGKTTLSRKFKKLGFIHYKMDSIKRGICKFLGVKTIKWTDFSKGVCMMIEQVIEDEREDNIIFDTPHISVLDAVKLMGEDAIVIFLGYDSMDFKTFKSNTDKYDKGTWSSELPIDELKALFEDCRAFSEENKKQCEAVGIKYFDVTEDRERVLDEAYKYVVEKLDLKNKVKNKNM